MLVLKIIPPLAQLMEVILEAGTNFYRLKLIDIGNNRAPLDQSRYKPKEIKLRK